MLTTLIKEIEAFMAKYGTAGDKGQMKDDLLKLIQSAVDHGEAKDQNKITGILVNGLKSIFGGRKD